MEGQEYSLRMSLHGVTDDDSGVFSLGRRTPCVILQHGFSFVSPPRCAGRKSLRTRSGSGGHFRSTEKERLAMDSGSQVHQRGGQSEASEEEAVPANVPVTLVQEVAALWRKYLDGCEVRADDDFFALGGNSLIGIQIIDRVFQDYGVELSVRAFYLAQTPARVAELIARGRALP
ncbi:phosphopantetheine-binding protein [Streptomyces sp. NPDC096142]|uniref:phosphopantetheine-binding protein n=1 Tax=Streptomyces sp. NPDC096142 TaxID=3366077 RepID=UPI0038196DB1